MGVTQNIKRDNIFISIKKKLFDCEYSCAAVPPVQCSVSHLSRRTEPHMV